MYVVQCAMNFTQHVHSENVVYDICLQIIVFKCDVELKVVRYSVRHKALKKTILILNNNVFKLEILICYVSLVTLEGNHSI